MGCAVAAAAMMAGHRVTLLLGEGVDRGARGLVADAAERAAAAWVKIVYFVSVDNLRAAVEREFASADALVMAAAVGDFRPDPASVSPTKLSRRGGPITLRLVPTEDILAAVGATKRRRQRIVAFAVEDGPDGEIESKARREMLEKHADFVVLNPPAAMGSPVSRACILSRNGVALPWGDRPKETLAAEIVNLLA